MNMIDKTLSIDVDVLGRGIPSPYPGVFTGHSPTQIVTGGDTYKLSYDLLKNKDESEFTEVEKKFMEFCESLLTVANKNSIIHGQAPILNRVRIGDLKYTIMDKEIPIR